MRRALAAIHIVVLALPAVGHAQPRDSAATVSLVARLQRATWPASWITAAGAAVRDPVVITTRKRFVLSHVPEHFTVFVSADNRFALRVNGRLIGRGPARGTIEHWRYTALDLAPALHVGENVIAALVWNDGAHGAMAQVSHRTGLIVQGTDSISSLVNTDHSWRASVARGHSINDAGLASIRAHWFYYAAAPPERLDGRLWNWRWDSDDAQSTPAVELVRGTPRGMRDGAPYELTPADWLLVSDPLPAMESAPVSVGRAVRDSGTFTASPDFPASGTLRVPAHRTIRLLLDRREIINAYPSLQMAGGRDAVVRLTYAESLFDRQGRKGNRNEIAGKDVVGLSDEFVSDGASHTYAPFWWRSWRYLQLDITTRDTPLTITSLTAQSTLFPLQPLAQFESSDAELQQLWSIAFRTLRISAWETYMDSPYWEQLQYIGDTRITALLSYTLSNEDRLARQALLAFDQSRTAEGLTLSRAPTRDQQYIPPYSLLWVGMVHDFWMYRDDPGFVKGLLPGTRTVLDWFLARMRADGVPGYTPWWSHVDPAAGDARQTETGGSAAIAGTLVTALREAAALERAFGDAHRAAVYDSAATRTTAALATLWDESRGLLRDNPDQRTFSNDVNILALQAGAMHGAQQERLAQNLITLGAQQPGESVATGEPVPASIYFRWYLHKALAQTGHGDAFLTLLTPWRRMLGLGLTTFPEFSDPTRSDSHAWTAHPALDLMAIAAGITPSAPGFAGVRVAPNPGALQHLRVSMPHPRGGTISVALDRRADRWQVVVTLPTGVPGEFVWDSVVTPLPAGATTRVEIPARER